MWKWIELVGIFVWAVVMMAAALIFFQKGVCQWPVAWIGLVGLIYLGLRRRQVGRKAKKEEIDEGED